MKKDKNSAWFTFYKGGFVGWLETHVAQCSSWGTSLSHKYRSVINSFIFRGVQIVQSWNRKLGHTYYGLKTCNLLAKWFVLPNFPGSHQRMFQQTSALPLVMNSWLCATILEGLVILQRSHIKPNYFDWVLPSLAGSPYCGASEGRCRFVYSL